MESDYLTDNLYHTLGIPATASEETILQTLDSMQARGKSGFATQADQSQTLETIKNNLLNKSFRLRSMIFTGGFGNESLDLQLQRLKEIKLQSHVVVQEWINVYSSWFEMLHRLPFQKHLLEACSLTESGDAGDFEILKSVISDILEFLLDLLFIRLKDALTVGEKEKALAYFDILNQVPGFKEPSKDKRVQAALATFVEVLLKQMEELIKAGLGDYSKRSKVEAKALLSKCERDVRLAVTPYYDIFQDFHFPQKEKFYNELHRYFKELCEHLRRAGLKDKASFFKEHLKRKQQTKEPVQKLSTDSVMDPELERKTEAVLKEIENLAKAGKTRQARRELGRLRKKTVNPNDIHQVEKALADPFFLLDRTQTLPEIKVPYKLSGNVVENEQGASIRVLWFNPGFPVWSVKSFAFDNQGQCLGQVPTPFRYLLSRVISGLGIFLIIFLAISGMGGGNKEGEVSEPEILPNLSAAPEKKFSQSVATLKSAPKVSKQNLQIAFDHIASTLLKGLSPQNGVIDSKDFVEEWGRDLFGLPRQYRNLIFEQIATPLLSYLSSTGYEDQELLDWSLKMASHKRLKDLLKDAILSGLNKGNSDFCKNIIRKARLYGISLDPDLLQQLYEHKLAVIEDLMVSADSFNDLPISLWQEGIIELWEARSNMSANEGLTIVSRYEADLKEYRPDLLKILLDSNKRVRYAWENHVNEGFSSKSIEKRVKLEASHSLVRKGAYDQILTVVSTIPTDPENPSLLLLRAPVLYVNGYFPRLLSILESTPKEDTTAPFLQFIWGKAHLMEGNLDEAISHLKPLVQQHLSKYLKLWSQLNTREKQLREIIVKSLSGKKGKYREEGRRIYLIQDPKEAKQETEKFTLSEFDKDFNIKKIRKNIQAKQYVLESLYGLVSAWALLGTPDLIRKGRDLLSELAQVCKFPETTILLGEHDFLLGKEGAAKQLWKDAERACFERQDLKPLLILFEVYHRNQNNSESKRLLKKVGRLDPDHLFRDNVARTHLRLEPKLSKKIELLKTIRQPKRGERIQLSLFNLENALHQGNKSEYQRRFGEFLKKAPELREVQDDLSLIKELGHVLFRHYRLTGDKFSLDWSLQSFEKAYKILQSQKTFNQVIHTLWFQLLEKGFPNQTRLHFLKSTDLGEFWKSLEILLQENDQEILVQAFQKQKSWQKIHDLLKTNTLEPGFTFIPPPAFFTVLMSKPSVFQLGFFSELKNDNKSQDSFESFWADEKIVKEFQRKKIAGDKESAFAIMKRSERDTLGDHYSNAIIDWGEAVLKEWRVQKSPLKMGFESLLEKVELGNALKPNLTARRLSFDVRLARLALWFDPNKDQIADYPSEVVIRSAFLNGRGGKEVEIKALFNEASGLFKEYGTFLNDDLLLFLSLDPDFKIDLSESQINLFRWKTKFCADVVLKPLFEKVLEKNIVLQEGKP